MDTKDYPLSPKGYQQITSLGTAQALTVPAGARYALIQAENQNVRWRDDGTNPTASVGMVLSKDSDGLWYSGFPEKLRFIEAAAGATLNVSYYE